MRKNKIVIRADSSYQLGGGHLFRCIVLAKALKKLGYHILFLCKNLPGHMAQRVVNAGFELRLFDLFSSNDELHFIKKFLNPYNGDVFFIVDHYSWTIEHEKSIRSYISTLMVIDDCPRRTHDCDILLDQNYFNKMLSLYKELVPVCCVLLLGPQYALLDNSFSKHLPSLKSNLSEKKKILVFFGSSDVGNFTKKLFSIVLTSHALMQHQYTVILGDSYSHRSEFIDQVGYRSNIKISPMIDDFVDLIDLHDVYLGSCGSIIWGVISRGIPVIGIPIVENQCMNAENGNNIFLTVLTQYGVWEPDLILKKLIDFLSNDEKLNAIALRARKIVFFNGADAVASAIMAIDSKEHCV